MNNENIPNAAAAIRQTASQATPGPWRLVTHHRRKYPTVIAGMTLVTPERATSVSTKYAHNVADARWNALTNPAAAEPLAALLDAVQRLAFTNPCLCARNPDDPTCRNRVCDVVRAAAALADTLLQDQP